MVFSETSWPPTCLQIYPSSFWLFLDFWLFLVVSGVPLTIMVNPGSYWLPLAHLVPCSLSLVVVPPCSYWLLLALALLSGTKTKQREKNKTRRKKTHKRQKKQKTQKTKSQKTERHENALKRRWGFACTKIKKSKQVYLKIVLFKIAKQFPKYLGHFWTKICRQKIWKNRPIWSHCSQASSSF